MSNIIYLAKDNSDLICHCKCNDSLISFPPQMDCPWCGCGWLFTCMNCRKAFTFARGVKVDESWEELARRDILKMWKKEPSNEDIESWIESMKAILADVKVGKQYAILDGAIIPTDDSDIVFDGMHSHHEFQIVPLVLALNDRTIIEDVLSNVAYWKKRALERE